VQNRSIARRGGGHEVPVYEIATRRMLSTNTRRTWRYPFDAHPIAVTKGTVVLWKRSRAVEAVHDLNGEAGMFEVRVIADGEVEVVAHPHAWQALDSVGWPIADEAPPVG
jgi:hypothetical protein